MAHCESKNSNKYSQTLAHIFASSVPAFSFAKPSLAARRKKDEVQSKSIQLSAQEQEGPFHCSVEREARPDERSSLDRAEGQVQRPVYAGA
jgi:hypothetical protein